MNPLLARAQCQEQSRRNQSRNFAELCARPAFRVTRPLAAGASTITHSLALNAPYAVIVQARSATTGEEILLRAYGETANTVVLQVSVLAPSVQLTIIG